MPFLKARPAKVFSPYVCVYYDLSLAFSVSYEMNKEQKKILASTQKSIGVWRIFFPSCVRKKQQEVFLFE